MIVDYGKYNYRQHVSFFKSKKNIFYLNKLVEEKYLRSQRQWEFDWNGRV